MVGVDLLIIARRHHPWPLTPFSQLRGLGVRSENILGRLDIAVQHQRGFDGGLIDITIQRHVMLDGEVRDDTRRSLRRSFDQSCRTPQLAEGQTRTIRYIDMKI